VVGFVPLLRNFESSVRGYAAPLMNLARAPRDRSVAVDAHLKQTRQL
jgi:hypothetical protein